MPPPRSKSAARADTLIVSARTPTKKPASRRLFMVVSLIRDKDDDNEGANSASRQSASTPVGRIVEEWTESARPARCGVCERPEFPASSYYSSRLTAIYLTRRIGPM